MSDRHLTACWNCETRLPRTAFKDYRCPLCGARNDPPAVFLFLALAFLGLMMGWLGGMAYGAIVRVVGWDLGWALAGQVGAILGAVVIGGLGFVAAFLLALRNAAANRDKEVLLRGAEIRRARAEHESVMKVTARSTGEPLA
ncbi:MAG TPA: hypothetical protein VEL76_02380 [Gemmataceae bacterium]|nr:hypothetical protein [Gemmataceae bacterium]